MKNTDDIKNLFIHQYNMNNYHTSGYSLSNGNEYLEVRCVQFIVDKDYIFNIPGFVDKKWYDDNYEPVINKQYNNVINELNNNYKTRHAIFYISLPEQLQCTMYVMILIDKINNNYEMTYIVHMRSNDVVEFNSDIKFHKRLIKRLLKDINYNIENVNIIWNVDSMQLYDKYVEKCMKY